MRVNISVKMLMGLRFGKWRGHLATQAIARRYSPHTHHCSIQASAYINAELMQNRGRDLTIMLARASVRNYLHTSADYIYEDLKLGEL